MSSLRKRHIYYQLVIFLSFRKIPKCLENEQKTVTCDFKGDSVTFWGSDVFPTTARRSGDHLLYSRKWGILELYTNPFPDGYPHDLVAKL